METQQGYKIQNFRIQLVAEGEIEAFRLCGPEDVSRFAGEYAMSDREVFACFHLDSKNRVIAKEVVSVGTLNQTLAHPREIFKAAIMNNSAAIILCHNHPSGNVEPSAQDNALTKRMADAGKLLGIPVHDHVIVSPRGFYYAYSIAKPELLGP